MEAAQAHADGETSKRRNVSMTKAKKELLDVGLLVAAVVLLPVS